MLVIFVKSFNISFQHFNIIFPWCSNVQWWLDKDNTTLSSHSLTVAAVIQIVTVNLLIISQSQAILCTHLKIFIAIVIDLAVLQALLTFNCHLLLQVSHMVVQVNLPHRQPPIHLDQAGWSAIHSLLPQAWKVLLGLHHIPPSRDIHQCSLSLALFDNMRHSV